MRMTDLGRQSLPRKKGELTMQQYNIIDIIRAGIDSADAAKLIEYGLTPDELTALTIEYIVTDHDDRRTSILDLLTEINYHSERRHLEDGEISYLLA